MDKSQIVEQLRELISDAETAQALDKVEAFLKSDGKYKLLYREAVEISAFFQKTKRDEEKGLISFENANLNYNRVNDRLLNLLDYIETGNLQPDDSPEAPKGRRPKKWLLILLPLLLVAGYFGAKKWMLKSHKKVEAGWTCPSFGPASLFNVMVLPYLLTSGGQDKPQALIVERLEDLSEKYNLRTSTRILENYKPNRLLSYKDATDFGKKCNANMVIWGRSEQNGPARIIKTRFKFLGDHDAIAFTRLKWQGERQVDTVRTLSSLASGGDMTADIEQVILLVLGVSAKESGDAQTAIAALESVRSEDSTAVLLKNMVLADSYLGTGQKQKALLAYDSLLQVHPDYWLARNNRGVLLLENGDNLGAIEDFSSVLEKRKDPDVFMARAKAYQKSEQPQRAKKDYETVIQIEPSRAAELKKPLEETSRQVEVENNLIRVTPNITATPSNKNDILKISEANKKLGNFEKASHLLQKGIEANPKDPKFYASIIELLLQNGKKKEAASLYKDALANGIKKEELYRLKPSIKKYYEMRMVRMKKN